RIGPETSAGIGGGGRAFIESRSSVAKPEDRIDEGARVHRVKDAGHDFGVSPRRAWRRTNEHAEARNVDSTGSRARSASDTLGDGAHMQGGAHQLPKRAVEDAGLGAFKVGGRLCGLDRCKVGKELPAFAGKILPIGARDG